ncbi:MAG: outer membrane protein [Alphaproteobacteria bacterium]
MMKKISYALLGSALLTSVAQAEDATAHAPVSASAPTSACNFSGFYMGLGLGYGGTKHDFKYDGATTAGGPQTFEVPFASDGLNGGIFAGYGKEMGASRVYLGLEVAYLLSGDKHKGQLEEFKKKDALELALRLGVAMNNALPYLKVGFASSKFEEKIITAVPYIHKKSKRLNGFLIGAGVDLKVSRNVMMGLGYTYTMYKEMKTGQMSIDGGTTAIGPNDFASFKDKPKSHNMMVRVAYTF